MIDNRRVSVRREQESMRPARAFLAAGLTLAMLGTAACTPNTGKGAAIGAAAGAGLGALNGTGIIRNAATGAVVGAAGGFIYDALD
jgi:hypothetical protein